jgi:hypothetical protein
LWFVLLGLGGLTAGCGPDRVPRLPPVDEAKAKEALVVVLDGWKAGKKPEEFGTQKPEIIVQDLEWMQGAKLSDYKVTDKVVVKDARYFSEVQLNLVLPDGKEVKRTVQYVINTSPKLSVFRALPE